MDFIKRLFGIKSKEIKRPILTPKSELENLNKTISCIEDLFGIDIKNIDLSTFIKGDTSVNSTGERKTDYRKKLSISESDLFEYLEVIKFDSGPYNLVFTNHSINSIPKEKIKNLLNNMYLLYGTDDDLKNTFTENDWRHFIDPDSEFEFGRNWLKKESQQNVSIDKVGGVLSMTIWTE